jgi:hypothetical protein
MHHTVRCFVAFKLQLIFGRQDSGQPSPCSAASGARAGSKSSSGARLDWRVTTCAARASYNGELGLTLATLILSLGSVPHDVNQSGAGDAGDA